MILGLFFIALGALIHFGKFHNLIAGYNTMSASDKKKVDIEGIGKLFWYVMLAIGLAIIAMNGVLFLLDSTELKEAFVGGILIIGLGFLIWQSNSSRYKIEE